MGVHLPLKQALRRTSSRVRRIFARASLALFTPLLVALLGVGAYVAPSGAASARPTHGVPIAKAAKTLSLHLTASLHLVGRPGRVLYEKGTISGNLSGSASSRNTTLPENRGTSTFTIYTKGGSFSGQASTHGHVVGASAYFNGTATIVSATGTWAHAKGSSLQYTGVMNRQNFRVTDHILGTIHY